MTPKTKEQIYHEECCKELPDGIYPGMARDKHLNAMTEYANQEKRSEAVAFLDWATDERWMRLVGDPARYRKREGEPVRVTGDELYDLFQQRENQIK